MYRPEGLKNPYEHTQSLGLPPDKSIRLDDVAEMLTKAKRESFEAGADAIRNADVQWLLKYGESIDNKRYKVITIPMNEWLQG